jgi:hypothetical protein
MTRLTIRVSETYWYHLQCNRQCRKDSRNTYQGTREREPASTKGVTEIQSRISTVYFYLRLASSRHSHLARLN